MNKKFILDKIKSNLEIKKDKNFQRDTYKINNLEKNKKLFNQLENKNDDIYIYKENLKNLVSRKDNLNLKNEIGKKGYLKNSDSKYLKECEICDLGFYDSISYLNHLNSQRHNRMLGMNMTVKRSNKEKIKEKLLNKKIYKLKDEKINIKDNNKSDEILNKKNIEYEINISDEEFINKYNLPRNFK